MENFSVFFDDFLSRYPGTTGKLILSVVIFLVLILFRFLILKIVQKKAIEGQFYYQWRKISGYLVSILTLLLVGGLWLKGLRSLSTFLGLFSAGIAIALKDLLVNFFGWFFIILRKPFEIGDRIQIGDHSGDIVDIRIFQFTIMEIGNWVEADQSTGRIIHIPNGLVFTNVQANYSKGFQYIWNEIPVLVTFESDWQIAKKILISIVSTHAEHLSESASRGVLEASKRFKISYAILTPTVYTSVKDCGVMLTLRYLCKPRERRSTEEKIWEDVLIKFKNEESIDFAYPTQRFYNNITEGKGQQKISE